MSPILVFVSCAPEDHEWLNKIQIFINASPHRHMVKMWHRSQLEAGSDVSAETENAIEHSSVAIIFISSDYLASDLMSKELEPLLSRATHAGYRIMPIVVRYCDVRDTIVPLNDPNQPVSTMNHGEVERMFVALVKKIATNVPKVEQQETPS